MKDEHWMKLKNDVMVLVSKWAGCSDPKVHEVLDAVLTSYNKNYDEFKALKQVKVVE